MPLDLNQCLTLFPVLLLTGLIMNWLQRRSTWAEIWKKRALFRVTYSDVRPCLPTWTMEAFLNCLHRRTMILLGLIVFSSFVFYVWKDFNWIGLNSHSSLFKLTLNYIAVLWWSLVFSTFFYNFIDMGLDIVFRSWALWINTHQDKVGQAIEKRDYLLLLKKRNQLDENIPPSVQEKTKKRL